MAIKLINGKTILDRSKIDTTLENFYIKLAEVEANVKKLEDEVYKAKTERQELIYKSMLVAGNEYQTPIANVTAKIENYESMLATEKETLVMYKELLQNPEMEQLLGDFSRNITVDLNDFQDVEEKAIFEELAELRDKQFELMDKLNEKRDIVDNEVRDFNALVDRLGYPQLKREVSFHDLAQRPHSRFKQLGSIFFNFTSFAKFRFQEDMQKRVY